LRSSSSAQAQVANYQVVGDGIPQSLTGKPGDAARGAARDRRAAGRRVRRAVRARADDR